METKLIVGLGNPGKKYMHTPHNIGFDVIDEIAQRFDLKLRRSFRFPARLAKGNIEDQNVILAEPNTFMNLSGTAVSSLMRHNGLSSEELVVITDDANLPMGQLRIRSKGSSGGHKGLQSIIDHLGYDNFTRLRLGIGQTRQGANNLTEHVLTPFPAAIRQNITLMINHTADAVVFLLGNGAEAAMNIFNKPIQEDIA